MLLSKGKGSEKRYKGGVSHKEGVAVYKVCVCVCVCVCVRVCV